MSTLQCVHFSSAPSQPNVTEGNVWHIKLQALWQNVIQNYWEILTVAPLVLINYSFIQIYLSASLKYINTCLNDFGLKWSGEEENFFCQTFLSKVQHSRFSCFVMGLLTFLKEYIRRLKENIVHIKEIERSPLCHLDGLEINVLWSLKI